MILGLVLGLGAARGGGAILSGAQPPRTAILSPTRAVAFSWHCLVQHWYQNAAELLLFFGVWFCCWEEGLGNAARFSPSETGILGADPELRILDPAAFACQAMMRPPWPYPISFGFFSSGESTRVMGPKGAAFY